MYNIYKKVKNIFLIFSAKILEGFSLTKSLEIFGSVLLIPKKKKINISVIEKDIYD